MAPKRYQKSGRLNPIVKSKRGIGLLQHRRRHMQVELSSFDVQNESENAVENAIENVIENARENAIENPNENISILDVENNCQMESNEWHNDVSMEMELNFSTEIPLNDDNNEENHQFEAVLHDHAYPDMEAEPDSLNIIYECPSADIVTEGDTGSRIIDIKYFEDQIKQLNNHHAPTDCNFSDMKLMGEKRNGLSFIRRYKCSMCKLEKRLYSHKFLQNEEDSAMNINEAAVAGTILAGVGETVLNKILTSIDVPSMSSRTYAKHSSVINKAFEEMAMEDMKRSGEKAAHIARQNGYVAADGTPLVTVKCDGSWCKRSYKNTYNSTGGCGAIIAAETNEVLYIGIKNKFCIICTKARNKKEEAKEHDCFKNWPLTKSAAAMETSAIVEGFLASEKMHGVRYHQMIADGDSAVYKAILDANPYENLVVRKIECKNHLLRNFCNNIKSICSSSSGGKRDVTTLKKLVDEKTLKLRSAINKAVEYRARSGISNHNAASLAKDIINAPSHVFGEHLRCAELGYFCDGALKEGEVNIIPKLRASGIYEKIMEKCNALANNATSLLFDENTNAVEAFNSMIAMRIGGKRCNYTGRGSYHARIASCVSSMAHGETFRFLHKKRAQRSPGTYAKRGEKSLLRKRQKGRICYAARKLQFRTRAPPTIDKGSYGQSAQRPDLSKDNYDEAKGRRLEYLAELVQDRSKLEEETRGQNESPLWMQLHKKLVTASNFGRICSMRSTTSSRSIVESLLYANFDSPALRWGRAKENLAKTVLENVYGWKIRRCGLFIHPRHFFIGASPDGIIENDLDKEESILEIKCPYSLRNTTVQNALQNKAIKFLAEDGSLKKNHAYYYQIQGQLEVTGKKKCEFVIWTPNSHKRITVPRDETFWKEKMEEKIKKFYFNCLLKEIVDPRKQRSMPLRNLTIDGEEARKVTKVGTKFGKREKSPKTGQHNLIDEEESDVDDPDPIPL